MFHLTARAVDGTLLFRTHDEARALFAFIAGFFPDAVGFCVMPDHVHVLPASEDVGRMGRVEAAYARWRNARRGERGRVWRRAPAPVPVPDAKHARRTLRYVHLNPCRAGLVDDPLAWPWSTHRDAVGLAVPAVRDREPEPARFHQYVSGDPTASVAGTPFPEGTWGAVPWREVKAAVAGVCRVGEPELRRRGPARTLALRTAWLAEVQDVGLLARELDVDRATVYRAAATVPARANVAKEPALAACVRALGDARFPALETGDLRRAPGWERYRRFR